MPMISLSQFYWDFIDFPLHFYWDSMEIRSSIHWNSIETLFKIYRNPMENLSKFDHQRGRVPRMVGPSQVSRHRPTISFRTTQITIVRGGGDHVNAFAVSSERFPLRLHRHALMPHSGMSCRAVMSPSPHDRFIFSSSTFSSIRNHLGSGI